MWDSAGKDAPALLRKGQLQSSPTGGRLLTDRPKPTKDSQSNAADLSTVDHLRLSRSDFVQRIMSFRDAAAAVDGGDTSDADPPEALEGCAWAASLKLWLDEISGRVRLDFSREFGFR